MNKVTDLQTYADFKEATKGREIYRKLDGEKLLDVCQGLTERNGEEVFFTTAKNHRINGFPVRHADRFVEIR